jgi:hypothetical protein
MSCVSRSANQAASKPPDLNSTTPLGKATPIETPTFSTASVKSRKAPLEYLMSALTPNSGRIAPAKPAAHSFKNFHLPSPNGSRDSQESTGAF